MASRRFLPVARLVAGPAELAASRGVVAASPRALQAVAFAARALAHRSPRPDPSGTGRAARLRRAAALSGEQVLRLPAR